MGVLNFNPLNYLETKVNILKGLVSAYDKDKKIESIEKYDTISYIVNFKTGEPVILALDAIYEKEDIPYQSLVVKSSIKNLENLAFVYHDLFHENTESEVINELTKGDIYHIYFIFGNEVIAE